MNIDIKIKNDETETVLQALDVRIKRALEAVGAQAENYAKMKCPVDTGLLRNSITHALSGQPAAAKTYHSKYGSNRTAKGNRRLATSKNAGSVGFGTYSGTIGSSDEDAVYIGTNVEYAPYVELGTQGTDPQPFLKPAVANHIPMYKRMIKDFLERG
jgi:HK97 gp10 family phage protein